MHAVANCKSCNTRMPASASACPHCGHPVPKPRFIDSLSSGERDAPGESELPLAPLSPSNAQADESLMEPVSDPTGSDALDEVELPLDDVMAMGSGSKPADRAADEPAAEPAAEPEHVAPASQPHEARAGLIPLSAEQVRHLVGEQPELLDAKSLEPVRGPFRAALSLAGDGDLRLDSAYALATLQLLLGEEYRAQLLNALPAAPPQQPGGQAPPTQRQTLGVRYGISPGEDVQDPLPLAREAYLAAREEFALRLALDWRDPDARANTELCIRRLRELDEFERQREEQEQEQDSEQQQEDGGDSEDQEESDEEESEQEQEEQQPGEGEREQEEEQQPEETSEAGPETPPEERLLTREEVKRLLDRLSEIEERRDELNARIQGLRRQPAEKDW